MRHEQMFAPLQCLKTMAHQKYILPFFSDCPTNIKFSKQNVTPSPYHAQTKKSTTLKHVKHSPPPNSYLIYQNCF